MKQFFPIHCARERATVKSKVLEGHHPPCDAPSRLVGGRFLERVPPEAHIQRLWSILPISATATVKVTEAHKTDSCGRRKLRGTGKKRLRHFSRTASVRIDGGLTGRGTERAHSAGRVEMSD